MKIIIPLAAALLVLTACAADSFHSRQAGVSRAMPPMAWDNMPGSGAWTQAGLAAVAGPGSVLTDVVPADIAVYCPGYRRASERQRAAFWVGMLSALAKHESTWNPQAVGGRGQWFGLTQISPATARNFGCGAKSGADLKDGAANISCAVRIAAAQVARDGYLVSDDDGWRGLGRDWAPFRSEAKRAEMAAFTSSQPYCSKA